MVTELPATSERRGKDDSTQAVPLKSGVAPRAIKAEKSKPETRDAVTARMRRFIVLVSLRAWVSAFGAGQAYSRRTVSVDRRRHPESHEAWVSVVIHREAGRRLFCHLGPYPRVGILTWCNTD